MASFSKTSLSISWIYLSFQPFCWSSNSMVKECLGKLWVRLAFPLRLYYTPNRCKALYTQSATGSLLCMFRRVCSRPSTFLRCAVVKIKNRWNFAGILRNSSSLLRPAARYAILKTQREQPPKWLTNKLSIKPPLLAKVQGRFCYA